jgi:hypothetical protein
MQLIREMSIANPVCTENLNSDAVVMKAAEDEIRFSGARNERETERRVLNLS